MAYTPLYIVLTDITTDVTIKDKITQAGWTGDDVANIAIQEAESYINTRLIKVGYLITDLKKSTYVKMLVIKYSKYVFMRDAFFQRSPSAAMEEGYIKWKNDVETALALIETNKSRLVDSNGVIIDPSNGNSLVNITTTTVNVERAITMDKSYTWNIDGKSYADEDVVGKKP